MNVKKIMKCGKENKSETVKQKAINNQQTTSSKMSHNLAANYNVIYPRSKRRSVSLAYQPVGFGVSYFILLSTTDKSEQVFCFQDCHFLVR